MKIAPFLTFITFAAIMIEPRMLQGMQNAVKPPATGSSVLFSGKTLLTAAAIGGIGYVGYCAQTKPDFTESIQENVRSGLSWFKKRKVLGYIGAAAVLCLAGAISMRDASSPIRVIEIHVDMIPNDVVASCPWYEAYGLR
jgi:hypothetical protein